MLLDSMAMDLDQVTYAKESYENYIYGSAEVVGLMCLRVFAPKNQDFTMNSRRVLGLWGRPSKSKFPA